MSVRFLSDEYMAAGNEALAADPDVRNAVEGVDVALQFEVKDGPEGDFDYFMKIGGGSVTVGLGSVDDPSATVKNSYETAAKLARKDLSNQMAFLTGKIKISGNMAVLMKHNAALDLIQARLSSLDIEY